MLIYRGTALIISDEISARDRSPALLVSRQQRLVAKAELVLLPSPVCGLVLIFRNQTSRIKARIVMQNREK
jgi:predicted RNA-binding Zn-ribbon protein involved in translation (DUF1610 family)